MTAAATFHEITPQPALRGAAANATGPAGYDGVAVVLRLPNVDPHAKTHRSRTAQTRTAVNCDGSSASSHSSRRGAAVTEDPQTDHHPTAAAQPETASSPSTTKLLALAWRIGIVAAAIGLVVLAYRIINGPPASHEAATPQINTSASGNHSSGHNKPIAPLLRDDAHASVELSRAEPAGAPVVTGPPVVTVHPAPETPTPVDRLEHEPPATSPTGEGIVAPDNSLPIAADDGVADMRNRSSTHGDPWRSVATNNRDFATNNPAIDHQHASALATNAQRPWATGRSDWSADSSNASAVGEDSPLGDSSRDYPETDPRTWRTLEDWYGPSAAPRGEYRQPSSEWEADSRNAARLRPEIEQPPLPR